MNKECVEQIECPACINGEFLVVVDRGPTRGEEYYVECPLCFGTGLFPPDPCDTLPEHEGILRLAEAGQELAITEIAKRVLEGLDESRAVPN